MLFDAQHLVAGLGTVLHELVGVGVHIVDAEIVGGQGLGDAGVGDGVLSALHLAVDVVHADDDVFPVAVLHAHGFHAHIGRHAAQHQAVGEDKGAVLVELPQHVFLGERFQEQARILGIHHPQHVFAA